MNFNTTNMFNGMFGKIASGMCRLSMSGKMAIKTSQGYKTYDVKTGRLTNCDSFVFDIGEDFFFLIPTNHLVKGDVILAGGKPRCVIEVKDNEIKTFCYEDSTISTIVPEHHVFMGKTYFYGKIVSLFNLGGKDNGDEQSIEDDLSTYSSHLTNMKNMMKYYMMSEMFKGGNPSTNSMSNMLPMMMFMNGSMGDMFDGLDEMFDFSEDETEEDK